VLFGGGEPQLAAQQEGQGTQGMADPVPPNLPDVDVCMVCGALTTDPRYEFYYVPLDQVHAVCYCERDYPGDTPAAAVIAHTHLLINGVQELKGARLQVLHASQYEQIEQAHEIVKPLLLM
jgi:hypothetical protein